MALVTIENGTMLAVGSVTDTGEITLNYVSPDARFRGISRVLLGALEARAVERGNARCTLNSTETAHRFYLSAGWTDAADAGSDGQMFGLTRVFPMAKTLY